jgi:hypothetical protein
LLFHDVFSSMQKVIWQRKLKSGDVQILTIDDHTFISDLRMRPKMNLIPQYEYKPNSMHKMFSNGSIYFYRWSLEIRKIQYKDAACYFCVMNSVDRYGEMIKLNVLRKFLYFKE